MAGVKISDNTIELSSPPITAIARGCSICDPAPMRECQRKHAGNRGERGHGDGAQAAASCLNHRVFEGHAQRAELMFGVEQ